MNTKYLLLCSLLGGLLLTLAWPVSPLTPLVFVAWIPLLFLADTIISRRSFFLFCYIHMLTWNAGTTWWIWNADPVAGVSAIVANSLLMCLPWWLYRLAGRRLNATAAAVALPACWLAFEYLHQNWELSWPWLTLGNVFAGQPKWVQWYEFTGTSGGSLWVLAVNLLLYKGLFRKNTIGFTTFRLTPRKLWSGVALAVFPIVISLVFFDQGFRSKTPLPQHNVVIVQPNVDPYQKQDYSTIEQQVQQLLRLTQQQLDSNTRLVVWPETALPMAVMQDELTRQPAYQPVMQFLAAHPRLSILTGVETYRSYGAEKATATARLNDRTGEYLDAFNAATVLTAGETPAFYNKSKLVPGVEKLPSFLHFMAPVFEKFGGTTGGYGSSPDVVVLRTQGQVYAAAPIICYESIYGEYVAKYVRKGATLLTIVTNDGWWKNTPGHRQHLQYARLRAIETRRWIARSANTGISAVIDDYGNVLESRGWDTAAAIRYAIPARTVETFYVQHGDLVSKAACVAAVCLLVWLLFTGIKRKRLAPPVSK